MKKVAFTLILAALLAQGAPGVDAVEIGPPARTIPAINQAQTRVFLAETGQSQASAVDRGGRLGVRIQAMDQDLIAAMGGKGVLIVEIVPNSAAAQKDLRLRDVIMDVDGQPITEPKDLVAAIAAHPPGDLVTLFISRNRQRFYVAVRLGGKDTVPPQDQPTPKPSGEAGDGDLGRTGVDLAEPTSAPPPANQVVIDIETEPLQTFAATSGVLYVEVAYGEKYVPAYLGEDT